MSLEVKNITKKYGDKVVVDKLNFEIKEPGVYALLGTNGAGKTTALRIILGMLANDERRSSMEGKPLDAVNANVRLSSRRKGSIS